LVRLLQPKIPEAQDRQKPKKTEVAYCFSGCCVIESINRLDAAAFQESSLATRYSIFRLPSLRPLVCACVEQTGFFASDRERSVGNQEIGRRCIYAHGSASEWGNVAPAA